MARRKLDKRSFAEIDRGPLGGVVFDARKRLKLTQAQLAESIGRDRPWLSDVETGKVTHVPDEDLVELAASLSLEYRDLVAARGRLDSRFGVAVPIGSEHDSMTKLCPSCGNHCEYDARFCSNCGKPLPNDLRCSQCGRLSHAGSNFCSLCGSPLH